MSMEVDLAEIKTKVEYIEKEIRANLARFDEHIKSADVYREKVNSLESSKRELNEHIIQDRWIQGVMFSGVIAILTKVMGVW